MASISNTKASNGAEDDFQRLFLEDTVSVTVGSRTIVGVVTRTWHDLEEDEVVWEEIDEAVPGSMATEKDMKAFRNTGSPARHFLLFSPSSPFDPPMLVHESECTLLDRAFMFGDFVKRSADSAKSGTVISVDSTVTLRPAYFDRNHPELWPPNVETRNVSGSELELSNSWNIGDFVIYKNSWMGAVEQVIDDVYIKLQDDSVVVVDDPELLDDQTSQLLGEEAEAAAIGDAQGPRPGSARRSSTTRRDGEEPAAIICAGQHVTTTKANLRRGRWIYGAYNADIPAEGIIVQVKPAALIVSWICQNMMVPGRFIPIPPPDREIDLASEEQNLTRFKRASGGEKALNGEPYTNLSSSSGGADLQVGDRVRFLDIDAAQRKYQGTIKKIPKRDVQGFEVNIFVVCETRAYVRVRWQDNSETIEESRSLIPYLNIDEHDVWPGEIVIVKEDMTAPEGKPDANETVVAAANPTESEPSQSRNPILDALLHPEQGDPDYLKPSRVGVVQTADPEGRVAKVRWFSDPHVEVISGVMIPGSRTGELGEAVEDVSFYEVLAHNAIGMRRGDLVVIPPPVSQEPAQSEQVETTTRSSGQQSNPSPNTPAMDDQVALLANHILGSYDAHTIELLTNLSAALGNHSHPQLQALSRMLDQVPGLREALRNQYEAPVVRGDVDNAYVGTPSDWIGEVVDLGLDGLVTVRLGALTQARDVRLPIDRLTVIFNDDMDFGDGEFDDEVSEPDLPRVIEEVISYEGGERLDQGQEEDWATDDEDESDVEMLDVPSGDSNDSPPVPSPNQEPVPRTPPPIPDNIPAPEAITLPSNDKSPPRFMVLDTPVPTDHKYLGHASGPPSTALTKVIMREHKILAQSLPEGIFVRTWESRLDLLRVLIVGPLNTPYELAPFVFDFYMPSTFPHDPPMGFFHSWTNGIGKVNPNLYEDGNICLSLLGTWHADRSSETWNPSHSTMLQLLVSLMALVLVREPWYNEAGFSIYQGAKDVSLNSQLYSEKAYILSRGFVRHALEHPVHGLEDVINWLFLTPPPDGPYLLKSVVEKGQEVVDRSEAPGAEKLTIDDTPEAVGRLSKGALVMLKRTLATLKTRVSAEGEK